ncbi:hypothetical protein N5C43_09235 [Comamonas terrigena]|uniref:hypothetical protein n=1 Tax=Comamonas terrigena TaxID=32013 RepID=UPI0024471AEA|nr:hypothetical protein [Comamonas terrigena]MDH1291438.1 hypothetical protein [Comamonas terrigena]
MAEAQKAVVETAYGLAGGSIPFMEGVRQHALLRFKASKLDHDPDFMVFVVIASELNHLPPQAILDQCAQDWLEQCDNDAMELDHVPATGACGV